MCGHLSGLLVYNSLSVLWTIQSHILVMQEAFLWIANFLFTVPPVQTHPLRMTCCRLVPSNSLSQGKQRASLQLLPTELVTIVLDKSKCEEWQRKWGPFSLLLHYPLQLLWQFVSSLHRLLQEDTSIICSNLYKGWGNENHYTLIACCQQHAETFICLAVVLQDKYSWG